MGRPSSYVPPEDGTEPYPREIIWDESGVRAIVDHDGYSGHFTEQAPLREAVRRATRPVITLKELARRAGVSPATVYYFAEGRSLQPENFQAVREAMLAILAERESAA